MEDLLFETVQEICDGALGFPVVVSPNMGKRLRGKGVDTSGLIINKPLQSNGNNK